MRQLNWARFFLLIGATAYMLILLMPLVSHEERNVKMSELKPDEVDVTIEARRLVTEDMEILVPIVTAVDVGEKCTKTQVDHTVIDALINWYKERHHEQTEDQAGSGPDVQAETPEEDRSAESSASRVPKPGDPQTP